MQGDKTHSRTTLCNMPHGSVDENFQRQVLTSLTMWLIGFAIELWSPDCSPHSITPCTVLEMFDSISTQQAGTAQCYDS